MPHYGGFWRRVLAYIIDSIVVNIAVSSISFVLGFGLQFQTFESDVQILSTIVGLTGGLVGLVGAWLYHAVMESSSRQATVGKMALGMVVTDENGGRIGFGRATGRYFAKILSGMILGIGFFMIGWTARKQGLHDLIAGTLVYKARDPRDIAIDVEAFR